MKLEKMTKKQLVFMLQESQKKYQIMGGSDVAEYLESIKSKISDPAKEHFILLCLNTKNQIIKSEIVSIGHLSGTLVHPREVFKVAILASAKSIMIAHNHPSGDCEPSENDNKITKQIKEAGAFMNISLLDHLIVNFTGGYYSYAEQGRI